MASPRRRRLRKLWMLSRDDEVATVPAPAPVKKVVEKKTTEAPKPKAKKTKNKSDTKE